MCVALLFATVAMYAQSEEEILASQARLEELKNLSIPKKTDFAKVDELVEKSSKMAKESMEISVGLYEANKALSSDNPVAYAIANIQSLEQMLVSAEKISSESLPAVAKLVPEASEELKSVKNPLKLKGAKSAINYSNTVIKIVTEETAFQVKALTGIIKKATELLKK